MRALVAVFMVGLTLSGCSLFSTHVETAPDPAATEIDHVGGPILVTRQWGVVDGMLSVVVSNTSTRTLKYADAVITARDDQNVLVTSTSDSPREAGCCEVIDLPPGTEFGFYFDVGAAGASIARVDVVYRAVAWASASASAGKGAGQSAKALQILDNSKGAVVLAEVTSRNGVVPQARAQAFLSDANGDFLAVVSGRWSCFVPGKRKIRMQLFHRVPAGTQVDSVVIHPLRNDPSWPKPTCRTAGS